MRKLESAEIAAVEVIRSLRTSPTHARYVASEGQPSPVGHSQVPPESERMEAFTDILTKASRQVVALRGKQDRTNDIRHSGLKGKCYFVNLRTYIRNGTVPTYPCCDPCTELCLDSSR